MTRARKLFWLNIGLLVGSLILWVVAAVFGWLSSVTFVSHISMAALALSAIAGIAAGDAAVESESNDTPSPAAQSEWTTVPPAPAIDMAPPASLATELAPAPLQPVGNDDDDEPPGVYL